MDLYDDVITPSGKNSNANNSLHDDEFSQNQDSNNVPNIDYHSTNEIQNNSSSGTKKIGIYVGNLTWVCI